MFSVVPNYQLYVMLRQSKYIQYSGNQYSIHPKLFTGLVNQLCVIVKSFDVSSLNVYGKVINYQITEL